MFPAITAFYAGILGLIYLGLTGLVIYGRATFKVFNGDGGHDNMRGMIRAHANFIEYVPLILVLVALLESSGANSVLIRTMMIALCVVRALHPFGMLARERSPVQAICRGAGSMITWVILGIAAIMLIFR